MTLNKYLWCLLAIATCPAVTSAQDAPPQWVTEGPYVDARTFSLELPIELLASKIVVQIEVGDKPRHFVFDTGSPSIISASLAADLGLAVVDKQKGRDAHGAVVESDIVQADLVLGRVTFQKVPMFVADFSSSDAARCLIGDGVLGSEILPLCAWQIDLPNSMLRCNSRAKELDHVKGATKQRLYDFGYPHMPILDVRFADEAKSKAMFDTGSPEYFAISPADFEGAKQAGGIGGTLSGFGSPGASLGGQAASAKQLQGELKTLSVGRVDLGPVFAVLRELSPSVIGAAILQHFVVTLDAASESAYFDQYREGPFAQESFGFSLAFDAGISIALVWDDSPASEAGLRAGQAVTAINGAPTTFSCDGIKSVLRAMSAETIELEWEGGSVTLDRSVPVL